MYCFPEFLTNAFDVFASCYVYSCLICILLLFLEQTHLTLSNNSCWQQNELNQSDQSDFYNQVKQLLNPIEELNLVDLDNNKEFTQANQACFKSLTIRELRAHIKENQLHSVIRNRLGKSVSVAKKFELIACLNSL